MESENVGQVGCGQAAIDAEHHLQVELIDALEAKLQTGGDPDTLLPVLDQLIDYSSVHFLSEQLLMRLHGYPAYEGHLAEHERLLTHFKATRESLDAGGIAGARQGLEKVRDRLLQHIDGPDTELGAYLDQRVG